MKLQHKLTKSGSVNIGVWIDTDTDDVPAYIEHAAKTCGMTQEKVSEYLLSGVEYPLSSGWGATWIRDADANKSKKGSVGFVEPAFMDLELPEHI